MADVYLLRYVAETNVEIVERFALLLVTGEQVSAAKGFISGTLDVLLKRIQDLVNCLISVGGDVEGVLN